MGNHLSVSRAKESFLDRLKREREGNFVGSKLLAMSMGSNDEIIMAEVEKPSPKVPLPTIQKEVSSDESSSEEEDEEMPPPPPQKKPIRLNKAALDDIKRQESVKKLKLIHKEKQNAIKNALSSFDAPMNNKIVFEQPEVPTINSRNLFDQDEEEMDEEEVPKSFKLKKQFEGKKGEKLFELQSRFQGDDRFAIDEKFAEGVDDTITDARNKFTREELKERKQFRKEMQDWDKNELKQEHDHQLNILESITGESAAVANKFSKPTQKGMLRFDPSKKSHQKYLDVVNANDVVEEKDEDPGDTEIDSENTKEIKEARFYEVANNLTEAFQSKQNGSKPFSILNMLGIEHKDDILDGPVEEVKLLPNNKAFQFNQIRFKYESSDSEEDKAKEATVKKHLKASQKKSKFGKFSKSGVFHFNFFYRPDDERLKEGFKFLLKSEPVTKEVLQEKRQKLKLLVKNSIRKAKKDKNNRKPNIVQKRKVK